MCGRLYKSSFSSANNFIYDQFFELIPEVVAYESFCAGDFYQSNMTYHDWNQVLLKLYQNNAKISFVSYVDENHRGRNMLNRIA